MSIRSKIRAAAIAATTLVAAPAALAQTLLSTEQTSTDAYLQRAKTLQGEKKYDDAVKAIDAYIKMRGVTEEALALRVDCNISAGHDSDVVTDLNTLLNKFPDSQNTAVRYDLLGSAYRYRGRYDEAVAALNKAIEKNPDNAIFYVDRAEAYIAMAQAHREEPTKYTDQIFADINTAKEVNERQPDPGVSARINYTDLNAIATLNGLGTSMSSPHPAKPPSRPYTPVYPDGVDRDKLLEQLKQMMSPK